MKEEVKEIMKTYGGYEFFSELTAARIPFFFAAAVSNSEDGTEYICETVTPNTMGLRLADDKFAEFLDIRNNGFVAVPSTDLTSESIQALRKFQEARKDGPFYSAEALMEFAREQGIEIVEGEDLGGGGIMDEGFPDGASQSVISSVMRHAIGGSSVPEEDATGQMPVPVCHCETLDISWGTDGSHAYGEGFSRIDERHKGILKGNGSFLQEKEREAVSFNTNT